MTTYAIADQVPADCDYLTAGKEYEATVLATSFDLISIVNDDGNRSLIRWNDCFHLNGGNWRRVEHDCR